MARGTNNPNWLEVKKDFIMNPSVTLQGIADKYGVNIRTVTRHCTKEEWRKAREEVAKKVQENVQQRAIDEASEINERHTKAYKNMQTLAMTNLSIIYDVVQRRKKAVEENGGKLEAKDAYNSQQLKFLAEALRIAVDGERITLGLPTVVTKGEQDIKLNNEFDGKPIEDLQKLFDSIDAATEINPPTDREG